MFDPRNDSQNAWESMNYGLRARKIAHNSENRRNSSGGGLQFMPENAEQDDSGVCSPPLWKSCSPPLQNRINNYRYLSPASRAQAIARGQWEMMEMVKNMPESSYELSLKDLVEQRAVEAQEERKLIDEREIDGGEVLGRRGRETVKRQESTKSERRREKMNRSKRVGESRGLFLKMGFFPFFPGSKRKNIKQNNSPPNSCAKVSPKPEAAEWWRRRNSVGFADGEGGGTSRNSGSSGGSRGSSSSNGSRKRNGLLAGCCPFFCYNK